ncbi:Uncharacterised protein [Slackia heliotrinireducens]|uniref:HNH endonuclease n=1 Tax=Slackia heliotrinireducens (strain ATCC 29202 / DSM 20476 / NCTC 11029 / RHS 1) TaxID=471855 RepID=C7N6P8_SLAHD|nr:hypothetical protein Shel_15640 [Slackia heliotrinireducens DSM 20476]VEH01075.1 Uncharacterised protein [Slackia heliotrinireducens]
MASNPRQSAARARVRQARRYAAANAECALCNGARGPIDYSAPRDHMHPLSLVIDEIAPVARWREFGYESRRACACDPANWQPAHWICNALASDKRGRRKGPRGRDEASGTF